MLKFSTYEKAFEELLENEGLKKKAAKSGISYGTLKKVYNRGMAAWRTGHRPGTTPQQWGMARVNSYIGKGKGTYYGADADLSGKGKKKKESVDEASLTVRDATGGMSSSDKKRHADMVARNGAKTKYSGSDVSYHGTDSQIQKALHIHHPDKDDKNRSLKYHKSGQHGKDHGSGATHTYRESTVKEISKGLAKRYIGKAARDVFHKGRDDATQDAIGRLGGTHPDQNYKKGPERKAAMRVRGIDRATKRLANATIVDPNDLRGRPKKADPNPESKYGIKHPLHPANIAKKKKNEADDYHYSTGERVKKKPVKKEATTSDAERKAIDAFIKKGKMKKLKPGYAAGYHGKSDPGAGMKGMISPADTKQFGTKKKIGSMK
jgi:hypothetical protein